MIDSNMADLWRDTSGGIKNRGIRQLTNPRSKVEPGTFGFPCMFTGELVDAYDLVYLRARYYHPAVEGFTGFDPVEDSHVPEKTL